MRKYVLAGFMLVITLIYAYRLDFPAVEYYDEVYHVKTAREFLTLSGNTDTAHPPLGKIIIAAGMKIFGDKPPVWRITSLLFGLLTIWVFFLLCQKFLKDFWFALLATFLLAIDGIFMTQSRIAMLNTPMIFFMVACLWFFIKAIETKKIQYSVYCGIFLGLSIGTRWVGAGILPTLALVYLAHPSGWKSRWFPLKEMALASAAAIIAYFVSNMILPFLPGYTWKDLWTYQQRVMSYHSGLTATHGYGSEWWSWPVMTRPIWYFFERKDGFVYGIFCIGNPIVLWMLLPALGHFLWKCLKEKSGEFLFVFLGFLSQWIPWAMIGRVKFFHYYYTAMPFVVLLVVLYLRELWKLNRHGRTAVYLYVFFALVMFFYWYPLYNGMPVSEKFFQSHLWFKSWI